MALRLTDQKAGERKEGGRRRQRKKKKKKNCDAALDDDAPFPTTTTTTTTTKTFLVPISRPCPAASTPPNRAPSTAPAQLLQKKSKARAKRKGSNAA